MCKYYVPFACHFRGIYNILSGKQAEGKANKAKIIAQKFAYVRYL